MNSGGPLFHSKTGLMFPGLTTADYKELWRELLYDHGIVTTQVVEAASYSMAMVVRHALGLSASGGNVYALVADTLSGWTALATLRHLTNAGARGTVLSAWSRTPSSELELQLKPLNKLGIPCLPLNEIPEQNISNLLASGHNVICGLFDHENIADSSTAGIVNILNELRTPVHCLEAPLGINIDSGQALSCPLFASSTLSLGVPLAGLYYGSQYVGRHYLCDISIPPALYRRYSADLCNLFAEQPVNQIFPLKDPDTD